MTKKMISFGELQEMNLGKRELPTNEKGNHQIIEGCERETVTLIEERKKVNAALRGLRTSIKNSLERLEKIRNGEFLDMYSQDNPPKDEDVQVSIADWRETVEVGKQSGETYSPDDDQEDEDDGGPGDHADECEDQPDA